MNDVHDGAHNDGLHKDISIQVSHALRDFKHCIE